MGALSLLGRIPKLSEAALKAFTELAEKQRGAPENAMLDVQRELGGGVMNPQVEDVGDLIHRMTERRNHDNYDGMEYVHGKAKKALRGLDHPYGFEKEHGENILNNSLYIQEKLREQYIRDGLGEPSAAALDEFSPDNLRSKITDSLVNYATEHEKLPVYNRPQYLSRKAAVALGNQDFETTRGALRQLLKITEDPQTYKQSSSVFGPRR